jgi:hypothetical protein
MFFFCYVRVPDSLGISLLQQITPVRNMQAKQNKPLHALQLMLTSNIVA